MIKQPLKTYYLKNTSLKSPNFNTRQSLFSARLLHIKGLQSKFKWLWDLKKHSSPFVTARADFSKICHSSGACVTGRRDFLKVCRLYVCCVTARRVFVKVCRLSVCCVTARRVFAKVCRLSGWYEVIQWQNVNSYR